MPLRPRTARLRMHVAGRPPGPRSARLRAALAAAAAAVALHGVAVAGAAPAAPALPLDGGPKFAGVGSCAGTQCHGAVAGAQKTSHVLQNEYRTWMRKDPHRRAAKVLRGDLARQIVEQLGLRPATEEPACLACHATALPVERRGAKFDASLDDGITCEACHGGAELWLSSHANARDPGAAHEDNLRKGMYPTDDAERRAELCLSCHLGDQKRFVTHRMMAAGHPRMSFELQTFTQIQPKHFQIDADYRSRKQVRSAAETWAIGQLVTARQWLALVADPSRNHDGGWPEFTLYDCYSCHQVLQAPPPALASRSGGGAAGVGFPRLASESLGLTALVATAAGAPTAGAIASAASELATSGSRSAADTAAIAARGAAGVDGALAAVAAWNPTANELRQLIAHVASMPTGSGPTYMQAEQRTMAAQALVATLALDQGLEGARLASANALVDRLFQTTQSDASFRPAAFGSDLSRLGTTVR